MTDTPTPNMSLADIFSRAAATIRKEEQERPIKFQDESTLGAVDEFLSDAGSTVEALLTSAVIQASRLSGETRHERDDLTFIVADKRGSNMTAYTPPGAAELASFSAEQMRDAIVSANKALELIHDISDANNAPVFKLLGLRNLSGFVGEVVASEVYRLNNQHFLPNPNQDGYPDLLATTREGLAYIQERERLGQTSEKAYWSPYPHGGIEVKATCGDTPPARTLAKPAIGEPRRQILISANWKSHHRGTNNLVGVYWDFMDGLPTVLAAFYRNDLTEDDWGKMVVPKEGGGNTTSVSIMRKGNEEEVAGVKKMGAGWLVLPEDETTRGFLCQRKAFDISDADIASVCTSAQASTKAKVTRRKSEG